MQLVIAAVGRVREPPLRALLDDYYGRIRRYAKLQEHELRDDKGVAPEPLFEKAVASAGERAELVALEVTGKPLSSTDFAVKLGRLLDEARVPVFLLGGAEGLPEGLSRKARWQLSLSTMTMPHKLARIVLAEQVYRAFTILRGEPYAREG